MFIRAVDQALENLLRARLPLPEHIGDVTFEVPTSNWAAQLSRITVNCFLYEVGRSTQPARSLKVRVDDTGARQQRAPQPMIRLSYLMSAWAGTARDEHQLLGDVVSRLAACPIIPPEMVTMPVTTSVSLLLLDESQSMKTREIWSAAGGQLKAGFVVEAHVGADSFDWEAQAPAVQNIEQLTSPIPRRPALR